MIRPEEMLVCRIVEQAIEDYTELKAKNLSCKDDNTGYCSIIEIEHFFDSDWCSYLLNAINFGMSGKEIFNQIKAKMAI